MGKTQIIEKLFLQILTYSFLLPVVVSLVYFNKPKPKNVLLIVGIYGVTFFLLNQYFDELVRLLHRSLYYFIYTLTEYATFASLLYLNIKSRKARFIGICISILFTVFLYLIDFVVKFKSFDSIPIATETLILLVFSIYFFYEQFKDASSLYIYYHYCFWLTIGILIYLCGSLFIFVFADQMTPQQKTQFWFFTYVVEIIKNFLFTIALILYSRKSNFKPKKIIIPYLDIKEL